MTQRHQPSSGLFSHLDQTTPDAAAPEGGAPACAPVFSSATAPTTPAGDRADRTTR
jgi:hypothetical protein